VSPTEIVDEIFRVYRERGHRCYGENVTELQHALQCAAFAREAGESPEVVAASLLHDFGHLLHDHGEDVADRGIDTRHERLGAARLSRWFDEKVVEPVRLHAASKRYLCWKEPDYHDALSEASRKSLALQGGPMKDSEAARFETDRHFDAAIRVRRLDDRGKIPDMKTPDLEDFRPLLEALATIRG
jgi:phosphonate degradation associated HDIG domain protein